MKIKISNYLLVFTMLFSLVFPFNNASAQEVDSLSPSEIDKNIIELPSEETFINNWKVIDEFGSTHYVSMNYETNEMTIDGEIVQLNITKTPVTNANANSTLYYNADISATDVVPTAGPTIDYSTGINVKGTVLIGDIRKFCSIGRGLC